MAETFWVVESFWVVETFWMAVILGGRDVLIAGDILGG